MSGSNQADPRTGERAMGEESRGAAKDASLSPKRKPAARPADVGRALRSVYDDTLREDIPSEFTDLLGRLG